MKAPKRVEFVFLLLLIGFFSSCFNPEEEEQRHKLYLDSVFQSQVQAQMDSLNRLTEIRNSDSLPLLSLDDSNAVYGAFELSATTQAFVITAWYDHLRNASDSLLSQLVYSGNYFKDGDVDMKPLKGLVAGKGRFPLIESEEANEKFKTFLEGEFYIVCTKNVVKRKVKQVLFSANLCNSSFFAFTFDAVDPEKDGHPLLASRRKFDSPYSNPVAEKQINRFNDSLLRRGWDYNDSLHLHVFAQRDDSLIFIYSDDFRWAFVEEDKKCFFPGRYVVVIRPKRKIEYKWTEELDLFGVPCD